MGLMVAREAGPEVRGSTISRGVLFSLLQAPGQILQPVARVDLSGAVVVAARHIKRGVPEDIPDDADMLWIILSN
jgi:hypothetical protein